MSAGAVPLPESLLFSTSPTASLVPVSGEDLLASVSLAELDEMKETCEDSMQCVYDTLASGSPEIGLQSLEAQKKYYRLAQTYGKLP